MLTNFIEQYINLFSETIKRVCQQSRKIERRNTHDRLENDLSNTGNFSGKDQDLLNF